jgi:hypothetical protein
MNLQVIPQPIPPVGVGATTTPGSIPWWGWALGAAAAGTVVYYASTVQHHKGGPRYSRFTSRRRHHRKRNPVGAEDKGPGWYVLLYNYPSGHGDRRLKGYDGPFATKSTAQVKADAERNIWYPAVRHLKTDPFTRDDSRNSLRRKPTRRAKRKSSSRRRRGRRRN